MSSIEWMRKIDRWLGGLLVIVLGRFFGRVDCAPFHRPARFGPGDPFSASSFPVPVKTLSDLRSPCIVVSKYFGLGSVILADPLLGQIRRQIPQAKIIFITFSSHTQLLSRFENIDQILTIRTFLSGLILDTLRTLVFLRRTRPDVFLDLEFFSRYSALVNFLSGAPIRAGFHTLSLQNRRRLLTHPVYWNPYRHAHENFCALGSAIGLKEKPDRAVLRLRPAPATGEDQFSELMRQRKISGPFVILSPIGDTLKDLKSYPVDRWLEFVDLLHEKLDLQTVCVASEVEPAWKSAAASRSYLFDLTGQTDLNTLMSVIQHAECLVGVDNGVAHLAAVFQIPAVTLFGPETPVLYAPLNSKSRILYRQLHCSPCLNLLEGKQGDCRNNVCLKEWTPKDIYDAFQSLRDLPSRA